MFGDFCPPDPDFSRLLPGRQDRFAKSGKSDFFCQSGRLLSKRNVFGRTACFCPSGTFLVARPTFCPSETFLVARPTFCPLVFLSSQPAICQSGYHFRLLLYHAAPQKQSKPPPSPTIRKFGKKQKGRVSKDPAQTNFCSVKINPYGFSLFAPPKTRQSTDRPPHMRPRSRSKGPTENFPDRFSRVRPSQTATAS